MKPANNVPRETLFITRASTMVLLDNLSLKLCLLSTYALSYQHLGHGFGVLYLR